MELYPCEDQHKSNVTISKNRSSFARLIIRSGTREQVQPKPPKGPIGLTTLYDPDGEVVADLIFVHGLNGGSQSTWTKNQDDSFWPRKWLAKDEAFRDVRIHTFGYASGLSRESVLNIPDFARSLLYCIHDSPSISRRENVPLILIGHSMGGLVIKKAFILGHDIPELKTLVRRVCGMFFLATPHRGSDLAQTLHRIFSMTLGPRPFVQDLSPDSPVLESINEEFPRYCSRLKLFSFFENRPMNFVLGRCLIVEKDCAVMNYMNERKMYLDANHRDVARFSSPNDPSYIAIRNALATYIEQQRNETESARQLLGYDQLEALNKSLGVSDLLKDDLTVLDSIRFPGSCEWLIQKEYFRQWRDGGSSKVLWLRGRPGAGKSVLSSHVINHLRDLKRDCCFFFFTEREKQRTTIDSLLRSMARQMAVIHREISSKILEISANWLDASISKVDHNPTWLRLYLRGILKIKLNTPQYWVIDSLDECNRASELMTFLTRVQEFWPLCLLITSRNPVNTYMSGMKPSIEIISEKILEEDTKKDISLFLKANIDMLPSPSLSGREGLADQILQASGGCFLWVNLILKELRQVNKTAEITKVLTSNPEKMNGLYTKILTDMANSKFGKDLAMVILTWTTCAFRPLSTEEIHSAIELDIRDTIDDVERSIDLCCGNLVYVDIHNKVQLIHLTVREFLIRQDVASEFIIKREGGHKRLALVCLQCLSSNEMRQPWLRNRSIPQGAMVKSPLADYACRFMFKHLAYTKSYDDEVFVALSEFLKSINVLTWIEYLATHSELQLIFQAGETINNLLNLRPRHTPPIGPRNTISLMECWGKDLAHLVTKFGKQLLLSPTSIHNLIPPFCPRRSAINQQFSSHRGLSIHGLSSNAWDDCLSIIDYSKPAKAMTLATSKRCFAIGMSTGKIIFYDDITCEESQVLDHREPVLSLAFGASGKYLASSGAKSVRVWDLVSFSELFTFPIPKMCMALTFTESDGLLLGAIKDNQLMYWDIANGGILCTDPLNWTKDLEELPSIQFRQPTIAAFHSHQNLLAIIYHGEDILLWDFEKDRIHDIYEKESGSRLCRSTKLSNGSTTVCSLAFSSATDKTLLAAAYFDGDVVVYDTSSGTVRGILIGINAQTLSCSPDGRTLATADSRGTIQLFAFETLEFIYSLRVDGDPIAPRALAFTLDSHRIIDIRGNQCRMWNPVQLSKRSAEPDNKATESVPMISQEADYQRLEDIQITAIACVQSASIVFCGLVDGSVHVYDIRSELQSRQLFVQTRGAPITLLHFDVHRGILTCSDVASRVVSRGVIRKHRAQCETSDPLINIRIGSSVTNILTSGTHSRLLVSTDLHDTLWTIPENSGKTPLVQLEVKEKRHWIPHATNPDQLILITVSDVKIYHWPTLECLVSIPLSNIAQPFMTVISPHHSRVFATIAKDPSQTNPSPSIIQVWDFKDLNLESKTAPCAYNFGELSSSVEAVIGVIDHRLIFLDNQHWVSSVDLDSGEGSLIRHFFIPNDWLGSTSQLILDLGRNGEIIFVKRSELVVIKHGLDIA